MLIPITVKLLNTTEKLRFLFGREFTFYFDTSLTFYILKKYINSVINEVTIYIEDIEHKYIK